VHEGGVSTLRTMLEPFSVPQSLIRTRLTKLVIASYLVLAFVPPHRSQSNWNL
jgi:hypothetical protein